MTARAIILCVFLAGACAPTDGYYDAPRLGPGYVAISDTQRFGVSYLPDMEAALLTFTIVGSFDGEAPEPPGEADWRAAAEAAAPEGCAIASLEQVDEGSYRATYDCPDDS